MSRRAKAPTIEPVEANPAVLNPEVFGADLGNAIWMSTGLALTAVGNDRIVQPFVQQLIPQLYSNEVVSKLVDSVTTFATAAVLGELVGRVNRPIGHRVHAGGAVLAGGKLISVVLPGFQISASLPQKFTQQLPSFAPAPQLPPAQASAPASTPPAPSTLPRNPGL